MTGPILPPHLVEQGGKKICSRCKEVIDSKGSTLSKAFRLHVAEKHGPQTQRVSKKK